MCLEVNRNKTILNAKKRNLPFALRNLCSLVAQSTLVNIDTDNRPVLTIPERESHYFKSMNTRYLPELGRGDETVAVLVKVPQALNEVLNGVADLLLGDGLNGKSSNICQLWTWKNRCRSNLQNWEEGLEGDASLGLLVLHQAPDVGLSRVLAEGAKYLADLVRLEI